MAKYEATEAGTYGWVVDRAREILADKDATKYRWREAELLRFVDAGIAELRSRRPAAQYLGLLRIGKSVPVAPVKDDDNDAITTARAAYLFVDSRWHEAIIEYVVYRALLMDETDAANQTAAQNHRKQFAELCQM